MKVAHLSSVHPPFDIRIFEKECKTLRQAGHEVSLVVPTERDEDVDGIHVRAVPPPRHRWERITRTTWRVYRRALREAADVYHFHDPELIPAGLLLKMRGKRVVYDVHEDAPAQVLTKQWLPRWTRRPVSAAARWLQRVGGRAFDRIVPATPAIARSFPAAKSTLVQNFPVRETFHPTERRVPYEQRPANVFFVGRVARLSGAFEMVRAMTHVPDRLGARLVVAGVFKPLDLEWEARAIPGAERMTVLGWRSQAEVGEVLATARLGLCLYHPDPNHGESQPTKLFEYMAAGVPVLASNFDWWKELVEGAGCGRTVDPLDPRAIGEAITWFLENPGEAERMGRRGMEAVERRYNWNTEARKLVDMYANLANGNGRRPLAASR